MWKGNTSIVEKISPVIVRKIYKQGYFWMLEREVECLNRLKDFNYFPKFIGKDKRHFDMSYCGERKDVRGKEKQCYEILDALQKYRITHRDINPRNLLTLGNMIFLCDFGWAIMDDEKDTPVKAPKVLGGKYYINQIWDDKKAMEISLREGTYRR